MPVPYTFADQTGSIPLSELDANFANVQQFANTAGFVTESIQSNITSVGVLSSLNVSGNVSIGSVLTINAISANNIVSTGALSSASLATGPITANSISLIGSITGGLLTANSVNIVGPISAGGNILSGGNISATSNVTGGNLITTGIVFSTANITGGNILTGGQITATGNVSGGNILTAGAVSAAGNVSATGFVTTGNVSGANIVTANTVNAVNMSLSGNIVVAGNATVNGTTTFINTTELTITDKTITVANGVSTSALIDGAGIEAGSPAVSYLRYFNATKGWSTADNFGVGGNLIVTGNLSATGNTVLSGNATGATAANGTSSTQLATTAFVANAVQNRIPAGVILLWSGAISSIPAGWALCDGGNGTPDLRNSFVLAAGGLYAVGITGGSPNAVVVDHSHSATSSVSDPGHSHGYVTTSYIADYFGAGANASTAVAANTSAATTGITVSTSIANAGVSGTNANMPPYYALAYIMKL